MKIIKHLKIRYKLTIGYMLPLIIFLGSLVFWGINFGKIRSTALNIKNNIIPKINMIVEIKDSFNHVVLDVQRFITMEDGNVGERIEGSYLEYLDQLNEFKICQDCENNLESEYIDKLYDSNIEIKKNINLLITKIPRKKELIDALEKIEVDFENFYVSSKNKYQKNIFLERLLLYTRDIHAETLEFNQRSFDLNTDTNVEKEIEEAKRKLNKLLPSIFNVLTNNKDHINIKNDIKNLYEISDQIIEISKEIKMTTTSIQDVENNIFTVFNDLLIYQRDIVNTGITRGVTVVISTIIQFIILFIILIPISFLISRYLSNRIVSSIKKLIESTKIIAKGNLDHKIEIEDNDEIGELSNNFNIMAKELSLSKDNIVENILSSIPAFVVVFESNNGKIRYINSNLISSIPEIDEKKKKSFYIGKKLEDIIPFIDKKILTSFLNNPDNTIEKLEIKKSSKLFEVILFKITRESEVNALSGIIINNITETKFFQEHILNNEKLITLGRAASGIAHEINNPLYVILSKAEEISEMKGNKPKTSAYAEEIINLVVYISNIIKDLSSYSRNIRKEDYIDININESINEAMNIVRYCFNFLEVEIVKNFSELPNIIATKGELLQIFINIINNAIYAMDSKGKLIIETSYKDKMIIAKITDTGKGIKKEDEKYIYDLYFSSDGSGTSSGQGLHIVKKILDKYKAKIEFNSEYRKGTTFTIFFPAS